MTARHPRHSPTSRTLDALVQDARSALRNVAKRPAFAAVAVATLALGIGANTAAFSVLHGVVLARLPYPEPDRLMRVAELRRDGGQMSVAEPNFEDWRTQARSFDGLAAYSAWRSTVLGADRPALATAAAVSEAFFRVFGVEPAVGRRTLSEEHRLGADPAAVVSHRFWRSHLGGRELDDLTLDVAGFDVRIVGVLPPGFDFPEGTDLWYPMELSEPNTSRTAHNWQVVGRLRAGTDPAAADRELDALTARVIAEDPSSAGEAADYLAAGALVTPLLEDLTGPVRRPLLLLLGAAGLVLLVACSNLASAFLARGIERQREMAVRVSLGAGAGRLLRQLFAESLLVALAGAAAGLALAWGILRLVLTRAGTGDALPRLAEIGLHGPVLGFTLAISALTALLFGVLPGLGLVRRAPSRPLHGADRGSADRGRRRAWRALVVVEVALAVVLLAGSGLLLRSLWEVLDQDPGFDPERVTAVSVHLPASLYPGNPERRAFFDEILERLAERPEVAGAGVVSSLPLGGSGSNGLIQIEGGAVPDLTAEYRVAGGEYFESLSIPLFEGRAFDRRDHPDAPHAAIVNRALADAAWPGESPLGKRLTGGGMDDYWDQEVWATVVGVVGDVRQRDLTRADRPTVYFHHRQRPFRLWAGEVVVRSREPAERIAAVIDGAVRATDPQVPYELRPMDRVVLDSVARQRFAASLLAGFALVGLTLAALGIYGVVSYTVAQRRRELGIRLALGASPRRVRNQVVASSMATVGAGIALGLAGALAAGRLVASLLYGVEPTDPATLAAVAALLAGAAFLATYLPARETVRIDPVETLKAE
jgi:putative ABC transport system permease protein